MILGIGTDLLHVPRLTRLLSRYSPDRFAKRILCQQEYEEFKYLFLTNKNNLVTNDPSMTSYLGVRWAVKEAAFKALYPHARLCWHSVYLRKVNNDPKPQLIIHHLDHLQTKLTLETIQTHCSISHDGEYITANVLMEI